jgi:DNA-binding Lrp family transcriptional regulator
MNFDKQEALIVRALIKDPRLSDNSIGKLTRVPIRTVSRKRKKMEDENKINYYLSVNHDAQALVRHIYLIKFRMGITKSKLIDEIKKEPKVKSLFTDLIYESHFGEIDGHTAILMIVEGKSDDDISENFNGKILSLMIKNHGEGSIIDIKTIRLSERIRIFHNYLPWINMKYGKLKKEWPLDNIYVEN